jgi:hypothetical protein
VPLTNIVRYRRVRARIAIAGLLFLSTPPALPTNDMRPVTVLVLSQMCMAQDPGFRNGAFGRYVASNPLFQGWAEFDRRPLSQCLRTRQWIPATLCESLRTLNPDDPQKLDAWWHENVGTLQALEPLFDFYGGVVEKTTSASPCPTIALQPNTAPLPPDITIERVEQIWAGQYAGEVSPVPQVTLVKEGNQVAAAVGVHFGINFKIVSTPAEGILTVLYKISVPEPGLPGNSAAGRRRTLTDRPQCVLGRTCVVGFVFETEDEIVPGTWLLEVSFRGKTLMAQEFTVYREPPATQQ